MSEIFFQWPGQRQSDLAHHRVAEFLVIDIQRSPEWARDLLEKIQLVQSGNLPQWERIGNAFCLELSANGATIDDLVDETIPAQTVSLEELQKATIAWLEQTEVLNNQDSK